MKNLSLLFIAFLFLQLTSSAQQSWFWQNPLPQGDRLNDVFMIDENNIVAVGGCGTVMKSINGGADWYELSSGTTYNLYTIQFKDSNTGWAIGGNYFEGGIILKTTNGGNDWITQLNTTEPLWSSHFINHNYGWAVGEGTILKTTNGGEDWLETIHEYHYLDNVYFLDDSTGFITDFTRLYRSRLFKTTDGGDTWAKKDTFPIHEQTTSIFFPDSATGWMTTNDWGWGEWGSIHKTTDRGETWNEQLYPVQGPQSVHFLDDSTGWVVGGRKDHGIIHKTTNGGDDWLPQLYGSTSELLSVHFTNNNTACAVGKAGVILVTSNAGEEWTEQSSSATLSDVSSIEFIDNNIGWAAGGNELGGDGTILKTTNGGEEWSEQFKDSTIKFYKSVQFVDSLTGWVVSGNYDQAGKILNTTNGGEDWITKLEATFPFRSIHFIDSNTGWGVGEEIIINTTDGGINWTIQANLVDALLNSVYFIGSTTGWTVGNGIFKTTDGGENWFAQSFNYSGLKSVYFTDNNTGWVVGYADPGGSILKTTNGGDTWIELSSGGPWKTSWLEQVYFVNNNLGWIVGRYGTILHSTNGGSDWELSTVTSNDLNSVFFLDNNIGWITGEDCTILKTTNGGVTFVEGEEITEIAYEYNLSQNYPNPFNSTSIIRYSVPNLSNVVIKVYDILGNEIETLINEEKPTGTYEITWYAEQLPSGIYFYRLQAGNFVKTKKMMLLK